jgi:flagellar biogenesis protein FliO
LPSYRRSSSGKSEAAASLIKMLVALGVVVVCIYVGIFLLKKLVAKRHFGRSGNALLEVIETAYIDPKKSLSLVRVADNRWSLPKLLPR